MKIFNARVVIKPSPKLIIGVLVAVIGVCAFYINSLGNLTDCRVVSKQAHKLITQKEYTKMYNQFDHKLNACLGFVVKNDSQISIRNKITKNTEKFIILSDMAQAAYRTGNKSVAIKYADHGMSIGRAMKDSDRKAVPNYNAISYSFLTIKLGIYRAGAGNQ